MSFPRFHEYKPGTILEIIADQINDNKSILLIVTPDASFNGLMFRNTSKKCCAVRLDIGGGIMEDYVWDIVHQEVKRGGLRDDNTR